MVRMAAIDDIDDLVELRIQLLKEVKNIENYNWEKYSQKLKDYYKQGFLKGKVIVFLAEESGKIVAISVMCFYNIIPSPYNLDGKMALLTDLYTIPEYRNRGFGTKLLNSIMEYSKDNGYSKVILNATDSGRRLYEKYGFKDMNREMSYRFV